MKAIMLGRSIEGSFKVDQAEHSESWQGQGTESIGHLTQLR